jgi:hypothetical protein
MARIDRFTSRVQAELARGLLTANGFDAIVLADDAGGNRPEISFGIGGTVVVVPDHQLEAALALLDTVADAPFGDEAGVDEPFDDGPPDDVRS